MQINKNTKSVLHNTTVRTGAIQYICIHYVGATGDAKNNVDYYSQPTVTDASADFFVGHTGDIWQYNPDPKARYCWAVGGGRQSAYGGSFYGKAKNSNSISIEMCVKTRGGKTANSPDWYFTDETIAAAVELTRYLMELYNVPVERVIRHFDVTGKFCPGVVGWNAPSGSESAWKDFQARIASNQQTEEDDDMTQEQFNRMMDNYLAERAQLPDAAWGAEWEEAKRWAEENGIILGDENGNKQYQAWTTRQALVLMLCRQAKK